MEKQLVIFELGKEFFGIEISDVEAIVKMQEITKIPQALDFVEGVMNLRGAVLPVIDLEKRFGMPSHAKTNETRIMVINFNSLKVGMVVAGVSEVLTIDESIIDPKPSMVSSISTDYITGIAKIESRLVILLDLAKVLTVDEKQQIE